MFAYLNYRSIYYIYTDHLGSYCTLTNTAKQVVQRNFFDPWGNAITLLRGLPPDDPQAQEQPTLNFTLTPRGFTGHEHYPYFRIINMNGRLYDPVIGRFFSPDKYVANSSFTQDFNRYSYARNCPLMYTDPDGEFVWFVPIIGAMVGAMINMAINANKIESIGQMLAYAGIGALSGFAGGAASVGVGAAVGVSSAIGFSSGFGAGFASGFVGGFAGGFISGAGNSWLQGSNFWQGIGNGVGSGMTSGIIGGFTAGIVGGVRGVKTKGIFYRGCDILGISPEERLNPSDKLLMDAKNAWFKEAYLDSSNPWTTENLSSRALADFKNYPDASAVTYPDASANLKLTGKSFTYFHPERAFASPLQLFTAMGHELVHVSQYAALAGQSSTLLQQPFFLAMLDMHAYLYSNSIGGSYDIKVVKDWPTLFPNHYSIVDNDAFPWTLIPRTLTWPF